MFDSISPRVVPQRRLKTLFQSQPNLHSHFNLPHFCSTHHTDDGFHAVAPRALHFIDHDLRRNLEPVSLQWFQGNSKHRRIDQRTGNQAKRHAMVCAIEYIRLHDNGRTRFTDVTTGNDEHNIAPRKLQGYFQPRSSDSKSSAGTSLASSDCRRASSALLTR